MTRRSLMKFTYIVRAKDSFYALPPERQKEIIDALSQKHEKLKIEGTLKEAHVQGYLKVSMYYLDSFQDLMRLAARPIDAEIIPFVDADVYVSSPPLTSSIGPLWESFKLWQGEAAAAV
jgi:hypothetical protein